MKKSVNILLLAMLLCLPTIGWSAQKAVHDGEGIVLAMENDGEAIDEEEPSAGEEAEGAEVDAEGSETDDMEMDVEVEEVEVE